MAYHLGDDVWLVVTGPIVKDTVNDPDWLPANVHPAKITGIDVASGTIEVTREAYEDTLLKFKDQFVNYPRVVIKGLSSDEDVRPEDNKVRIPNEGDEHCAVAPLDREFQRDVDDMVKMKVLNDAELCKNLRLRFQRHEGFCRCGITLVAMNLFRGREDYMSGGILADLYSEETKHKYMLVSDREKGSPHIWNLTSHCYHNVKAAIKPPTAPSFNQAIVITGESGAGKTFCTEKVLDYLSTVGAEPALKDGSAVDNKPKITDLMLSATPILEGWGNANMPRNPNSSRFGKLYKVYFSPVKRGENPYIIGCSIDPYMLEKSRVTSQQMNERGFHIMYRLIYGAQKEELLQKLKGKDKQIAAYEQATQGYSYSKDKFGLVDFVPNGHTQRTGTPGWKADKKGGGEPVFVSYDDLTSDYLYVNGGEMFKDKHYQRIYKDLGMLWKADDSPGQESCCPDTAGREFEDGPEMCFIIQALNNFFNPNHNTPEKVDAILGITAGVLHLGNIEMTGSDNVSDQSMRCGSDPRSQAAADWVSKLWQVDKTAFLNALNVEHITVRPGQPPTAMNFGRTASLKRRDALARAVFDGIFNWMVEQITHRLMTESGRKIDGTTRFLGVLDIFGFEFVPDDDIEAEGKTAVNGLDQFCINTCNELLQNEFVRVVFGLEMELYQRQFGDQYEKAHGEKFKLELGDIENGPTVDLLMSGRANTGIPSNLKNAATKKNSTDADLYNGMLKSHSDRAAGPGFKGRFYNADDKRKSFKKLSEPRRGRQIYKNVGTRDEPAMGFCIKHYAGDVTYDVDGWVEKNNDKLSSDLYTLLENSGNTDFIAPFFAKVHEIKGKGNSTIVGDFNTSLNTLQGTLQECNCNFVRCIKASNPLDKEVFGNALVLNQLKYTGMLDTLKIRRKGFPFRMTHQEFWDAYHVLFPQVTSPHVAQPTEIVPNLYDRLQMEGLVKEMAQNTVVQRIHEATGRTDYPPADQITEPCFMGHDSGFPRPEDEVKQDLGTGGGYATAHQVFLRDWLGAELDKMTGEAQAVAKATIFANVMGAMNRKKYQRFLAKYNIQTVMRTWNVEQPYQIGRFIAIAAGKAIRQVLPANADQAQEEDLALMSGAKAEMQQFLEENVAIQAAEAEERAMMAKWDDYCFLIEDAKQHEKDERKKEAEMEQAQAQMQKARNAMRGVEAALSKLSAPSMNSEDGPMAPKGFAAGVVRSVPLVRRYRANAKKWTPPPRSAYKYTYEFTVDRPDN